MACRRGRLAVTHGPYVFLAKNELNMSSGTLGSGHIHLLLSLELEAQCDVIRQLMS